MRVVMGPYKNWFGPYQLARLLRHVGVSEDRCDALAEYIPAAPFEWVDKLRQRRIRVRIDPYDTWSADTTIAKIVHPLLVQLREDKHGAPLVDDADAPEHLRAGGPPPEDGGTDPHHFERWDYVMDEMIFAFGALADSEHSWEDQFHSGEMDVKWVSVNPDAPKEEQLYEMREGPNHTFRVDKEGLDAYNKRIENGLRLFAKYYRSLWD